MDKNSAIEIANRYSKIVNDKYPSTSIYLFGSFANGNNHLDSDIDIAVVLSDFNNLLEMQLELMRLRRLVDIRIEPHPIRKNDFIIENPLAFEVMTKGIKISLS